MSDPAKYRSKDEVQKMRAERDPIEQLKKLILEKKASNENALKDIDKKVKAVVAEAATFAETSPEPDLGDLYTDVLI